MKFTVSIDIARPRHEVAQLLADPENLPKWLRGLVAHEPIEGVHGNAGTTSRVVFRTGNRQMEAVETITRRDPADLSLIPPGGVVRFDREIVGDGMSSSVSDQLTELDAQTTHWVSENEYRFTGFVMRIVGAVMPSMFRKQTRQHMLDFKAFAEDGRDVRDGDR